MSETKQPGPGFEALPEEKIEPAGVPMPKPTSEHLACYARSLGDGTRQLVGLTTGFDNLDRMTLGIDGLTVLAGIPGKGKTSLALQVAYQACRAGAPVLLYSLEMPRRAIYTKILSRLARVSYSDIMLRGRLCLDQGQSEEGRAIEPTPGAIRAAMAELETIADRFYVLDKTDGALDLDTLEAQVRLVQAEHQSRALVVIDHLQIFPTGGLVFSGIKDKIDYLIAGLETIKDRTGGALLVISQKNRAGYYGRGLESLMGSAQIEYTADAVWLLDTEQEKDARAKRQGQGKSAAAEELDELMSYAGPEEAVELIIAKQRYNAPGRVQFSFNGRYSEFTERQL